MTNKRTNKDDDKDKDSDNDEDEDNGIWGTVTSAGWCSGWGGVGWALFKELQEGLFVEDGDAEGGGFV
jgi:hypothetical protein